MSNAGLVVSSIGTVERTSMWIMISGPYTSGARDDAEREANLLAMNLAAVELLKAGHVPIIGVNMALPVIHAAGPQSFDSVMMPLSLALAERCDACLRIGGPSAGADAEASVFRRSNKPVFSSIAEVPPVAAPSTARPFDLPIP